MKAFRFFKFPALLAVLTLCLAVGLFPAGAVEAGTEGDFQYAPDYWGRCCVTGYTGTETEVVVPETLGGAAVEVISYTAFRNNTTLTGITLPAGLVSLEYSAFDGCTALTRVTFTGEALTTIGECAFEGCTALTDIVLPDSVTYLGRRVFWKCTSLTKINIPLSLETAVADDDHPGPFGNCPKLTEVTIPKGMLILPDNVLKLTPSVEKAELPSTLWSIGSRAFQGCSKLTEVTIPAMVTSVGAWAFQDCTGLTSVTFAGSVCSGLGERAFMNCTALTEVKLPDSIQTLGGQLFRGCTGLRSVNIPVSLTYAERRPLGIFLDCPNLTSITVPEGVTELPGYLFASCSHLEEIILPSTLTEIGAACFQKCTSLKGLDIPGSVAKIGANAFEGCTGLTSLALPAALTSVPESAFLNCTGLESVTFSGELVESVGDCAFEGCTELKELTLPDSITSLGGKAFYKCASLKRINLPLSLRSVNIKDYSGAFSGCSQLRTVTIPEGMTRLPNQTFYAAGGLETIILPDSMTYVGEKAFYGSGLLEIWAGSALAGAGTDAFAYCSAELVFHGVSGSWFEGYAGELGREFSTAPITFETTAAPFGTVVDQNGAPLAGVSVAIYDRTRRNIWTTVVTDENGAWVGDELALNRTYSVRYHHPLYRFDTQFQLIRSGTNGVDMGTVTATLRPEFAGVSTPASEFTYEAAEDGAMTCTITGYTGEGTAVVVPAALDGYTVTAIGESAFYQSPITAVALPETVTEIGESAFRESALTAIDLPNRVVKTGRHAFSICPALTRADLPDGLCEVEDSLFYSCPALSTVNIPAGLTYYFVNDYEGYGPVRHGIFASCASLTHIAVPEGVTSVAPNLFLGAHALVSVDLPDSLREIEHYAFKRCYALSSIDIPDGVNTIGHEAFQSCNGLTEVTLPAALTNLAEEAFSYCDTLQSVTFTGDKPVTMGQAVFSGCGELSRVVMPVNLKEIQFNPEFYTADLFLNCPKLTTLVLPEGMTALADYALENCTSLTEVTLPSTLTSIGARAFAGCAALAKINIPDGVTALGEEAFADCKSLKQVNIPAAVDVIGASAFEGCQSLTGIDIPANVTAIGENAFAECYSLNKVTFAGSALTEIGKRAFAECSRLKEVVLPDSVTTLGVESFAECTALRSINIPRSLTTVGEADPDHWSGQTRYTSAVFQSCSSLSTIPVPDSFTALPDAMFLSCDRLCAVVLPDEMTYVGAYAFFGTVDLHVWVGEKVTTVGKNAFAGTGLTIHGIAGSWIEAYARQNDIPFSTDPLSAELAPAPTGRVVDQDGNPLAGVDVMVYDRTLNTVWSRLTTGDTGEWTGEALAACHVYSVRYYHPLYDFDKQMHVIRAGEDSTALGTTTGTVRPEFVGATTPAEDFAYEVNEEGTACTISGYHGDGGAVILPAALDGYPVTGVGEEVFRNNIALTAVALPVGLELLDTRCFAGTGLGWADLPNGLSDVGTQVFSGAEHLSAVCLSDFTVPGTLMFENCTALTRLDLPANLSSSTGSRFLSGCTGLTQVTVPVGVTALPSDLFAKNDILTSVILPDTLLSIGASAFYQCTALTHIDIPDRVSFIGEYAFAGSGLTAVDLPASLRTIESYTFEGCLELVTVTFRGDRVSSIKTDAFDSCRKLTAIHIPAGVTELYSGAFMYCPSLKDVTLPASVTYFGGYLFHESPQVSVTCPEGSAAAKYCTRSGLSVTLTPGEGTAGGSYVDGVKLTYYANYNDQGIIDVALSKSGAGEVSAILILTVYDEAGRILELQYQNGSMSYWSLKSTTDPATAYRLLACALDPVTLAPLCESLDLAI